LVGVNKSNSNTKSKTPLKGNPWGFLAPKDSCFQNQLDIAGFLIDGLSDAEPICGAGSHELWKRRLPKAGKLGKR